MPFVQLRKLNMHYLQQGAGKPLFILHGLGNNSQSWEGQLKGLSGDFQVMAWDAPGYGRSSDPDPEYQTFSEFADVLNEIVEELNLGKIHLLGHSMGAAIAIDFATRYPEKVDKLILADTPRGAAVITEAENQKKLNNRLHAINVQGSKQLAKDRTRNLLSEYASEELIQNAKNIMSQVRGPGYRSVSHSLFNLDQSKLYNQITHFTLLLCGELDRITPPEDTTYIYEQIPNSKLEIIPKTGHLCYMEDVYAFNQVVKEFLLSDK